MRNYILLFVVHCVICGTAYANYDIILTGIEEYNAPISYSNKTILVTDSAYIAYDCNFTLENCIIDVNGSVECNSGITLIDSVIRTKGNFKVHSGITITETGASSIIATGDSQLAGKIILEGGLNNRITVISDYVSGADAEFIILDANSSSNSSLKCIDFYGGWVNIQIYDKRLNNAISNCCFYGGKYGIWQDGLSELTTVNFSLFRQNHLSIYFGIDGTYRTDIQPLIDNVVIDNNNISNSYGVVLYGGSPTVPYFNYLGLTNSIITNCYCGWYIDAETFYPPNMSNIAYYGNDYDDNLGDSSFQRNPIYPTQSPFEVPEGPNDWPYFIKPDSPVADVNLGYDIWQDAPEQMLTSLYRNPMPRTNKGFGFGVPLSSGYNSSPSCIDGDFDESGTVNNIDLCVFGTEWQSKKDSHSASDFNYDNCVNIFDLNVLTNNWLSSIADYNHGDITGDNKVNFLDYRIFAKEWQIFGGPNPIRYPDANGYSIADFDKSGIVDIIDLGKFASNWLSKSSIDLVIDDNENLLTVTCQSIQGPNVAYYAFFLDGKYIASRDSANNPILIIDKTRYSKGTHYLRAAIKTADGNEYLTADQNVSFDSPLYDLSFSESFDPDKKFIITGKLNEGYTANIQIKDFDDQILWSNSYPCPFVAVVDSAIFSSGGISYRISYSYEPEILESLGGVSFPRELLFSSSGSASGDFSALALGGPPSDQTAGLVICMLQEGMKMGSDEFDTGSARFAARTMKRRNIFPAVLQGYGTYNQVNYDMLMKVFKKYRKIRYVHINSHGNYQTLFWGLGDQRTLLQFNDGIWPAFNSRKWTDKGLTVPTGYQWLSTELESAHCLNNLPFEPEQLKILVIESCYALRNVATMDGDGLPHYVNWVYDYEVDNHLNAHWDYPYSDICFGLNILNDNQIALGSAEAVISGPYPYWTRFFNIFWRALGDGYNVYMSLGEARDYAGIPYEVLWGHRYRGAGDVYSIYFTE